MAFQDFLHKRVFTIFSNADLICVLQICIIIAWIMNVGYKYGDKLDTCPYYPALEFSMGWYLCYLCYWCYWCY